MSVRPCGKTAMLVAVGSAWLSVAVPEAALAAAGPVGVEYAINDRTLPPRNWWTTCTDASGRSATILTFCNGSECDGAGDLFLQRYDAAGKKLGAPVKINEGPAWRLGHRVTCSDDGWVAAQWAEHGCYRHRAIDPDNELAGAVIVAGDLDCRVRANVAIDDQGGTVAGWPQWLPNAGSQIVVGRYGADGLPVGEPVAVSDDTSAWRVQPKIAIADSGLALVVWLGRVASYDAEPPVVGRFVTAGGQASGESFTISTFGYGENSDVAIHRLPGEAFEVAWNNPLEGGRIAREVRADSAVPAALRATASAGDLPRFGAIRVIDSFAESAARPGDLSAGATTWIASDGRQRHWRSGDDSLSWSAAFHAQDVHAREVLGSNGDGVWISLALGDSSTILLSRSSDDGQSWQSTFALQSPYAPVLDARVRGSGSNWVAAWTVAGSNDAGLVVFSRSTDAGQSWSAPKAIATAHDRGRLGMELATDGSGTWVVMLADDGIRFLRSSDGGKNWSAPAAVVKDAACSTCTVSWRYERVGLAADGSGNWVAVFAAPLLGAASNGRDGDLFVLRSDDGAERWSSAELLDASGTSDGSHDFAPQVATDGAGRWIAAWVSHEPAGGGDDLDSDVLMAVSNDAGETWSAPALLLPAMAFDEASDARVSLVSRGGRWMAAWERREFTVGPAGPVTKLVVAAADATCGNALTEVAEECDDGNLEDDDGCDSNCTASGCGNGIVNTGEQCDDGNRESFGACSPSCELPRCGDGFVSPWESCDDGNDVNDDACPNHCGAPGCGDGIVQAGIEECDDGGWSTAACNPDCQFARCGDGYVARRAEACDDGNAIDDDACPNDCSRAVCGDGFTSLGWEECDARDPFYASGCTSDCRLVGLCGDANADAQVTVADARRILRRAVGLNVDCPREACDMDSSGSIGVLDSHMDLRKAVGIDVGEHCSIGTGRIVFWIDDPRPVAAFQVDVDYSSTGGSFPGSGAAVACGSDGATTIADEDGEEQKLMAFNDVDEISLLTAGLITTESFSGRTDLFWCDFEMPADREDAHFAVHVVDATDPEGELLDPRPLVGYRVE